MKKTLISLAVAAGLAVSGVANAGAELYGVIDVALIDSDSSPDLRLVSTTSAFGMKGSEDLGGGMKAIYKLEFELDVMNRNAGGSLTDRDQFVGIKGGMGTVLVGTVTSNYKQMGGKIDPFYRTAIQARSVGQQSKLHAGAGPDGGRMSNAIQYQSPKMGGMQMIVNASFDTPSDEAMGVGFRYEAKDLSAWFDYFSASDSGQAVNGESGTKIGVEYSGVKNMTLGLQLEQTEDLIGGDVMFVSATYNLDDNNTLAFSYGNTDNDKGGFNLGVWHKLSKQTSLYAAINDTSDDGATTAKDDSHLVLGLRKKF